MTHKDVNNSVDSVVRSRILALMPGYSQPFHADIHDRLMLAMDGLNLRQRRQLQEYGERVREAAALGYRQAERGLSYKKLSSARGCKTERAISRLAHATGWHGANAVREGRNQ